jgi:hypothetical protein
MRFRLNFVNGFIGGVLVSTIYYLGMSSSFKELWIGGGIIVGIFAAVVFMVTGIEEEKKP